jgi:Ni/Co efflux regulator RcnB
MKKLAIAAVTAIVATVSLTGFAEAASRDNQKEWRHESRNHNDRGWRGDRGHDHNWRHHGWRHNGWRGGWRPGYWGGPRIVIAPTYNDYCFIKKVRHYDDYGNLYIKRVRVCR